MIALCDSSFACWVKKQQQFYSSKWYKDALKQSEVSRHLGDFGRAFQLSLNSLFKMKIFGWELYLSPRKYLTLTCVDAWFYIYIYNAQIPVSSDHRKESDLSLSKSLYSQLYLSHMFCCKVKQLMLPRATLFLKIAADFTDSKLNRFSCWVTHLGRAESGLWD